MSFEPASDPALEPEFGPVSASASEWWKKAYPGGKPDVTHPLPRPLYPPDATSYGKKPSVDGPDIVAWKRSISRGQRWLPFDPATWDDSFSNKFSHGRGTGMVGDSGVAGFQRQMSIQDSGWVGTASWDSLRYALIPPGFPHSGEHLIDGVAKDLFQQAWDLFQGHEPDSQGATLRKRALKRAQGEVGYLEGANNDNKYGKWYGMNYQPYCAIFCTWCFENEGNSPSFVQGSRYSYCPYIVSDARNNKNGLKVVDTDDVIPGDLVVYDWSWDGVYDHIGIFENWTGASFDTIEGNTSPNSSGSQSNGGGVYRRNRALGNQGTVFVRVAEP